MRYWMRPRPKGDCFDEIPGRLKPAPTIRKILILLGLQCFLSNKRVRASEGVQRSLPRVPISIGCRWAEKAHKRVRALSRTVK
jgi:hypothetical protein